MLRRQMSDLPRRRACQISGGMKQFAEKLNWNCAIAFAGPYIFSLPGRHLTKA